MIAKNQKYLDIIDTAKNLFWKYGFRRVSVEEICDKAKVSKMTFYKFFPNKIELAKTIFNNAIDEGNNKFKTILHSDIPAEEVIRKFVRMKVEGMHEISQEFMQDFYFKAEPTLSAFVNDCTTRVWKELVDEIKLAQKKGIFRRDFKPEFLVQISYKLSEFFNDKAMLESYSSNEKLMDEVIRFVAYGISKR